MKKLDTTAARKVDLLESGLLWLINTQVLHPRGYALALDTNHPLMALLLGDGSEPIIYDEKHEPVLAQRFAAVNALLAPGNHLSVPLPPSLPHEAPQPPTEGPEDGERILTAVPTIEVHDEEAAPTVHYLDTSAGTEAKVWPATCGEDIHLADRYRYTDNWDIVSCGPCRATRAATRPLEVAPEPEGDTDERDN